MNYELKLKEFKSLINDIDYEITLLSQSAAYIYNNIDNISWVGYYLLKDDKLILGPFNGNVACTIIKIGNGVCGTSFLKDGIINVEDVHQFKGHIACDNKTNSEIVLPIHKNDYKYGVLDIDSYSFNRFDNELESFLKNIVLLINDKLNNIK
jgi:GAF domain-containing protein